MRCSTAQHVIREAWLTQVESHPSQSVICNAPYSRASLSIRVLVWVYLKNRIPYLYFQGQWSVYTAAVHPNDGGSCWVYVLQVARLSRQHALYSALTFIYTHALDDYVAPIAELISAIVSCSKLHKEPHAGTPAQSGATHPAADGSLAASTAGREVAGPVSDQQHLGFKLMAYLRCCLQGYTFPPG